VAAGVVTAALLASDVWPGLRGPENWRWERRLVFSPWLIVSAVLFAATVLTALGTARSQVRDRAAKRAAWMGACVALIFGQMIALTAAEPDGLTNVVARVTSQSFTSYDTIARRMGEPLDFLRRYHRIQDTFPVHGPSQPPGRVFYFWKMRWLFGDERGPWIAGFGLMALGALSLVPMAVLVGGRCAPAAVGGVVMLMGSLPSFLLFTPQTDHLILFLVLSAAACLVEAMRYAGQKRAPWLAAAAGFFAGLGVFTSFTTLAALAAWGLAFAGMLALARRRRTPFPTMVQGLRLAAAGLAGAGVVAGATSALGMNWIAVFRECMEAARHVQMDVHGRVYSTWIVWNLADFALFLGPALVVAWLARWRGEWRDAGAEIPFASALVIALLALDVSGTILGETGRIWMFLMPLAVGAAASASSAQSDASVPLRLVPVAAAQFLVVLAMRAFLNVPG
jgi:hypothetical protein